MADRSTLSPERLERALLVPGSVFSSPREALESAELSTSQKIDVLRRWAYDAAEPAVALEEGMSNGDDELQSQVLLALEQLQAGIGAERTGPTKQHGPPD